MSEYPDNPNAVVKALRRALFHLFEKRRFDEAADYALSLKEPVVRYSPIEVIADRIFKKRAADALELYAVALESARQDAASATSGAEGSARMAEVHRLEKKLSARGKPARSRSIPPKAKAKPAARSRTTSKNKSRQVTVGSSRAAHPPKTRRETARKPAPKTTSRRRKTARKNPGS